MQQSLCISLRWVATSMTKRRQLPHLLPLPILPYYPYYLNRYICNMAFEWDEIYANELSEDGHIPDGYRAVQRALDRFVDASYGIMHDALASHSKLNDTDYLWEQIAPILRDNPPLATIPQYFGDGRENYLWYSDFYDDVGKEIFMQYGKFSAPEVRLTPANYIVELDKIDLPYFKELVNLVSLEKLYQEAERRLAAAAKKAKPKKTTAADAVKQVAADTAVEVPQPTPAVEQMAEASPPETPAEQPNLKRSYEPKLCAKQYQLLEECVNEINLFRRPVTATELKNLFIGKLSDPLQATNQKSLTYLLDQLVEAKYIKPTWITIAENNKDFISFLRGKNAERYGDGPHYITWQQFANCRNRNNKEYIEGFIAGAFRGTEYFQYDYRHTDGELFSTVAKTLEECRKRRDEWLNKKQ